jgi:hypothetical protein
MKRNGIFCLEKEWWGNYKRPTSVEPMLQLLSTADGWRIPYIHRNVATRSEFDYYINQWLLRRHADYPILYLAFHGSEGSILVGDGRVSDANVDFNALRDLIDGRGNGRLIHFGTCATMGVHGNSLRSFVKTTGLSGVCGYKERVDWMDSTAFDLMFLVGLGRAPRVSPVRIRRAADVSCEKARRLSRGLGFHAVIAMR